MPGGWRRQEGTARTMITEISWLNTSSEVLENEPTYYTTIYNVHNVMIVKFVSV